MKTAGWAMGGPIATTYISSQAPPFIAYMKEMAASPFPITNTQYSRVEASLLRNPDGTFVVTTTHGLDRYYFT